VLQIKISLHGSVLGKILLGEILINTSFPLCAGQNIDLIPDVYTTDILFKSACCASNFTWASTSNSEAQAARDKHNCRSCGGLVCDPCSKKRVPIPSIGITAPVRVCDRCYNGWGSLYGNNDSNESTRNVMESIDIRNSGEGSVRTHRKFERIDTKYSRRSIVVDELASRIPSINV